NKQVKLTEGEKGWFPIIGSPEYIGIYTGFYFTGYSMLKSYDKEVPESQVKEWINDLPFGEDCKKSLLAKLNYEAHKMSPSAFTLAISDFFEKVYPEKVAPFISLYTLGQGVRNGNTTKDRTICELVAREIASQFSCPETVYKAIVENKPTKWLKNLV